MPHRLFDSTLLPSIVGENQGFQGSQWGDGSGNNALMQKLRPPWSRVLFCALIVGLQLSIVYPMVLYLSKGTKYAKKPVGNTKRT